MKERVWRNAALSEIERLTPYKVPSRNRDDIMDDYNAAVQNDEVIIKRKRAIGKAAMQKAWGEDIRTLKGLKELAAAYPELFPMMMVDGDGTGYDPCVVNGTIQLGQLIGDRLSLADIVQRLEDSGLTDEDICFELGLKRLMPYSITVLGKGKTMMIQLKEEKNVRKETVR